MENIIFDQNTMIDDDTLDTSWIDLQNKIDNIHEHYFREPMQEISLFCIYANDDSNIEHVISEKEMLAPLSNGKMGINKDRLLHLIQTKNLTIEKGIRNGKRHLLLLQAPVTQKTLTRGEP